MKKIVSFCCAFLLLLNIGCENVSHDEVLTFGVCADYPPFEFEKQGQLEGFDIDLAKMIAKKLKKKVKFEDMQFNAILASIRNNAIDAGISTLTKTDEREKNFDFSDVYYLESLAMVYQKQNPITQLSQFDDKKIATQLGTTMEIWLNEHSPQSDIILMNNNNQAIEALKAGHVEGAFMDAAQAKAFTAKNSDLSFANIGEADSGYAIAVKKGSSLREKINKALEELRKEGAIEDLQKKWLEGN